jgi:hypothetical protein
MKSIIFFHCKEKIYPCKRTETERPAKSSLQQFRQTRVKNLDSFHEVVVAVPHIQLRLRNSYTIEAVLVHRTSPEYNVFLLHRHLRFDFIEYIDSTREQHQATHTTLHY